MSNGNYVEIKSGVQDGDTVYVEAKTSSASKISRMFAQMFGSENVNEPADNSWDTQKLQDMIQDRMKDYSMPSTFSRWGSFGSGFGGGQQ